MSRQGGDMSQIKIATLTRKQEAVIPVYRDKWRSIALSTERLDRELAKEGIKKAYAVVGKKEPDIVFFESPYAALNAVLSLLGGQMWSKELGKPLGDKLRWKLLQKIKSQLSVQIDLNLLEHIAWIIRMSQLREERLSGIFISTLRHNLARSGTMAHIFFKKLKYQNLIFADGLSAYGSCFDFCISVLNSHISAEIWQAYQLIRNHCGCFLPYESTCFISDRPITLLFDEQNRLHAEGEPAILFADGYSLYFHHGVTLPEKYGKVHPKNWKSKWLLEEKNAEIKRLLIQTIGYEKIGTELQATEIDNWKEYTLIKINSEIDIEPIYLLKMTCPSTGHPHILRVPPEVKSARQAITWINWGIDPEKITIQT